MTRRTKNYIQSPPSPPEHADPRHFYTTDHGHNQTKIKKIWKKYVKYEIVLVIFHSKTLTLVFPSLIPSDDFKTVRRNLQQKEVLVSVNMSARLFSLLQTRGPAGAEQHFVDQNFCSFGKIVVLHAQAHIFVIIWFGSSWSEIKTQFLRKTHWIGIFIGEARLKNNYISFYCTI